MLPIFYSDEFLRHDTGYGHPEKSRRLEYIVQALKDVPWADQLEWIHPQSCDARNPIPWIETIHHPDYIESVENLAIRGGGHLDPDTIVSPQTYDVALLAVSAWLDGVDQFSNNNLQRLWLLAPQDIMRCLTMAWGFAFLIMWRSQLNMPYRCRKSTELRF